jgi:hypothetical protein
MIKGKSNKSPVTEKSRHSFRFLLESRSSPLSPALRFPPGATETLRECDPDRVRGPEVAATEAERVRTPGSRSPSGTERERTDLLL